MSLFVGDGNEDCPRAWRDSGESPTFYSPNGSNYEEEAYGIR